MKIQLVDQRGFWHLLLGYKWAVALVPQPSSLAVSTNFGKQPSLLH